MTVSLKVSIRLATPKAIADNKAIVKLEKGPAKVMRMSSLTLVFALGNEIWTGLPQPIIENPGLAKIITSGMIIVPIGSIWARGSNVTRF